MSQQDDSENGFELVDRPKESNMTDGPTPLPAWINPNPPVNLPLNLVAAPATLSLPVGQLFPVTSTPTVGNPHFFPGPTGLPSKAQQVSSGMTI